MICFGREAITGRCGVRRILLLGVLVAGAVLTGCAQGAAPAASSGGPVAKPVSAPASSTPAAPAHYTALAPEGPSEQKAMSLVAQAYAAYVKSPPQAAGAFVYRDGGKVKPEFLGYYIRVFSPKKPNGRYDTASVLVLDGSVTSEQTWGKAGDMALRDLRTGTFVKEVPAIDDEPLAPSTDRQRAALAKARAWFSKYVPGQTLERVDIAGLTFAYGKPADDHWLLLHVQPETRGFDSSAR